MTGTFELGWGFSAEPVLVTRLTTPTPPWRFVVTDRTTRVLTWLDRISTGRRVEFELDNWAIATGSVPADDPRINLPWPDPDDDPYLHFNTRLLYGFRREGMTGTSDPIWVCRYAGIIMQLEDQGADVPTTRYTAFDPWMYLNSRPLLNGDGDLPGTNGLSYSSTRGDVIALQLLAHTVDTNGPVGINTIDGTIEATPTIDIKFDQGMSVGEAWKRLCATGSIDIVLTPIYDPDQPGVMSVLNIYERAGTQRNNVIFAWDKPPRSVTAISRLLDGTAMANNVQLFAGQGGAPIPGLTDAASVTKNGEYWLQDHYVGRENVPLEVAELALSELVLRKDGHRTLSFDPTPARSKWALRDYNLGDVVPIYASRRFRQPLGG